MQSRWSTICRWRRRDAGRLANARRVARRGDLIITAAVVGLLVALAAVGGVLAMLESVGAPYGVTRPAVEQQGNAS